MMHRTLITARLSSYLDILEKMKKKRFAHHHHIAQQRRFRRR
jgi:hypothetical protein